MAFRNDILGNNFTNLKKPPPPSLPFMNKGGGGSDTFWNQNWDENFYIIKIYLIFSLDTFFFVESECSKHVIFLNK